MAKFSVNEAKTHFSEVLRRVEAGEIVVVTRHNHPIAEIRATCESKKQVQLGAFAGELSIPADALGPLSEAELSDWYGEK